MTRPRKERLVSNEPAITYFKPRAVPLNALKEVEITVDEMEAIKLSDIDKLSQGCGRKDENTPVDIPANACQSKGKACGCNRQRQGHKD